MAPVLGVVRDVGADAAVSAFHVRAQPFALQPREVNGSMQNKHLIFDFFTDQSVFCVSFRRQEHRQRKIVSLAVRDRHLILSNLVTVAVVEVAVEAVSAA